MSYSVIAFICILIVSLVISLLMKKTGECQYDEMQLKLRGDGYKLGFLTTICLSVLLAFCSEWFGESCFSAGFTMLFAALAGMTVFIVFCIEKEALFSVGDNGKKYFIICLIVTAGNALLAADRIRFGDLLIDGRITIHSGSNLLLALVFGIITIALIVKMLHNKGIDNEES